MGNRMNTLIGTALIAALLLLVVILLVSGKRSEPVSPDDAGVIELKPVSVDESNTDENAVGIKLPIERPGNTSPRTEFPEGRERAKEAPRDLAAKQAEKVRKSREKAIATREGAVSEGDSSSEEKDSLARVLEHIREFRAKELEEKERIEGD